MINSNGKGAVKRIQGMLTRRLQAKFGSLPQEIVDRVKKIESEDKLAELAEKFVTASSLAELGLDKV